MDLYYLFLFPICCILLFNLLFLPSFFHWKRIGFSPISFNSYFFSPSFTFLCLLLSLCFSCLCNVLQFGRSMLLTTKCVWCFESHFLSGNDDCPQAACAFCTSSFPCCTDHCVRKILVCTWAGAAKYLRNTSLDSVVHLRQISSSVNIFNSSCLLPCWSVSCCHVGCMENKDPWHPVSLWFLVLVHSEVRGL